MVSFVSTFNAKKYIYKILFRCTLLLSDFRHVPVRVTVKNSVLLFLFIEVINSCYLLSYLHLNILVSLLNFQNYIFTVTVFNSVYANILFLIFYFLFGQFTF